MTDTEIKILQVGMPKSGNFWLYNIIREMLKIKEVESRSFIKSHPIYQEAKKWNLSHDQQAGIDMMDIEEERCYYRISSVVRNPIYYLPDYVRRSTHIWTHSEVCSKIENVLEAFNKIVYIYRDPRDMAISAARFAFTPYMRKYYPHNYRSVKEYLDDNYEKMLRKWQWHVLDYLLLKDRFDIYFVAYENLVDGFQESAKRLSSYLDMELINNEILQLYKAVNFEEMKSKNPDHVNKGRVAQWVEILSDKQKELASESAGNMLNFLNYPLSENELWKQPANANTFGLNEVREIEEELNYNPVEV